MIGSRLATFIGICTIVLHAPGCTTFDVGGIPHANSDGGPVDAPPAVDADPTQVCTPDQGYCDGHVLQMCNAEGTGPVDGAEQVCDFTCAGNACVLASDIPASVYEACDSTAPALTPPAGATVTFVEPAITAFIACTPHCGMAGMTTINAIQKTSDPGRAWFCLSSVKLTADVTVTYDFTIEEAVILLVDSTVEIATTIDFRGLDGIATSEGWGGPGGGTGGAFSASAANDGQGACPGLGGERDGEDAESAAGGGGGGAYGGAGGNGGAGRDLDDERTAQGGDGAMPCGNPMLIPLVGGSGGGGGADGPSGGVSGWPGGGGGGAIQIAARTSILITGSIDTSGGNGHGVSSGNDSAGGAGGGGSGGAILLESPDITINGTLLANGGNGGTGAGGAGGTGASGATQDGTEGASYDDAGEGGSGGGGGGGRIRINTPNSALACGAFASPNAICTSGPLPAAP